MSCTLQVLYSSIRDMIAGQEKRSTDEKRHHDITYVFNLGVYADDVADDVIGRFIRSPISWGMNKNEFGKDRVGMFRLKGVRSEENEAL